MEKIFTWNENVIGTFLYYCSHSVSSRIFWVETGYFYVRRGGKHKFNKVTWHENSIFGYMMVTIFSVTGNIVRQIWKLLFWFCGMTLCTYGLMFHRIVVWGNLVSLNWTETIYFCRKYDPDEFCNNLPKPFTIHCWM